MWNKYNNRKRAINRVSKMLTENWTCSSCEEKHSGLFDLAAFAPDFWNKDEIYSPNNKVRLDGDFLSEDFCVIDGESFFVRSILELPIRKPAHNFGFGVWSSLSKANFEKYLDGFDEGNYDEGVSWTGWFSTQIKGIENTIRQKCCVFPQKGRQRPLIRFMDEQHPVSIAQRKGLEAERLLEIYAANGHIQTP